ncbi:hypothetical protein [Actinomadura madurae]|uniref:hypothetical protein n=1 Tax=Actinomadura madurae TaxID=1993 RepID=UPI0020D20A41|nr:hypothetical protein [Actinomadura madurae]MCP9948675.1 hypothetical protein [Actinomadura madurae]MCP9965446.1 hypothetical protein [Actinomadura madurae]MCP9977936.1 hypothetical protein [Actinomadura madurae]MCQ0010563.1 hypothetical protein [Actinomadura madurae]MCQ0014126.1 hypothetical protein [Actinomadura madurae]
MDYSAVEIREENILALRAFLLEGPEAWVPLQEEIQKDDETAAGYMSLLYGAFNVALRRKFGPTYTIGEIVRCVADLRIKAGEDAYPVHPLVAESVIRRALEAPPMKDEGPDDVEAVLLSQVYILLYLVAEADFDRAGLEQFIEETTNYTKKWLTMQRTRTTEQL